MYRFIQGDILSHIQPHKFHIVYTCVVVLNLIYDFYYYVKF